MNVLKQHAVSTTDKVSLSQVEQLLNSVLKELQNEKLRNQQLAEQVRKLLTEQQQQATLAARVVVLEATAAKPSPGAPAPQLEEVNKKLKLLEAKLQQQPTASAPALAPPAQPAPPKHRAAPPKHREVPPPPTAPSAATSSGSCGATSNAAEPHFDKLDARISGVESRTTAALATARDEASQAQHKLRAQMEELLAKHSATLKEESKGGLGVLESKMESKMAEMRRTAEEGRSKGDAENVARRQASLVGTSLAAQAERLKGLEDARAGDEGRAAEATGGLKALLGRVEALEAARRVAPSASASTAARADEGASRHAKTVEALEERVASIERAAAAASGEGASGGGVSSLQQAVAALESRVVELSAQARGAAERNRALSAEVDAIRKQQKQQQEQEEMVRAAKAEGGGEGGVAAVQQQVASLQRQCDAAEAQLTRLAMRMPGQLGAAHRSDADAAEQPCVGVYELTALLERKLDRDEWPTLREGIVSRLVSAQQQLNEQQQLQQQQPPLATAAPSGAREQRRAPPPPQAWGEAGSAVGASSAAPSAAAGGVRDVHTHRLVDSKFEMRGNDGRLYRGAASDLVTETYTVAVPAAAANNGSRGRLARPASAGAAAVRHQGVPLASGAAAMRPTSAKSRPATGVLTASNTYTTSKASHWASGR